MSDATPCSTECCKAPGCPNKRSAGRFEGDFCVPCHLGQERLSKAAATGFTLGGVEHWNSLTANCAAAGMERANMAAERVRLLEAVLRGAPCTCSTFGTCSYPPQPTDHSERHWCGRCLALGFDKNPEPSRPTFFLGRLTV